MYKILPVLFLVLSCAREVKLSIVVPLTGPLSEYGKDIEDGVMLAHREEPSSKWGRVRLTITDNRGDMEKTRSIMERVGKDGSIIGVIGPVTSRNAIVAGDIAEYYQFPIIAPVATTSLVTLGKSHIQTLSIQNFYQGRTLAQFAIDALKCQKAGILLMRDIYSEEIAHAFISAFQKLGGEIVAIEFYTKGDEDFRAQLASMKKREVDCILVPGYDEDVERIISQARGLGLNVPLLGGDGWFSPRVTEIDLGPNFFVTPFFPDSAFQFTRDYLEAYGKPPTDASYLGYLAYKSFIEAINALENLTREELADRLIALPPSKRLFLVKMTQDGLVCKKTVEIISVR